MMRCSKMETATSYSCHLTASHHLRSLLSPSYCFSSSSLITVFISLLLNDLHSLMSSSCCFSKIFAHYCLHPTASQWSSLVTVAIILALIIFARYCLHPTAAHHLCSLLSPSYWLSSTLLVTVAILLAFGDLSAWHNIIFNPSTSVQMLYSIFIFSLNSPHVSQ